MITTDTFAASPCGQALKGDILTTNLPSLGLAVHLAYERINPSSAWKPYIDILPTSFTLPLLFEPEHWALLEGSPTLFDVLKLQKSTLRQYLHLQGVLKKAGHLALPPLTFQLFRSWHMPTTHARTHARNVGGICH